MFCHKLQVCAEEFHENGNKMLFSKTRVSDFFHKWILFNLIATQVFSCCIRFVTGLSTFVFHEFIVTANTCPCLYHLIRPAPTRREPKAYGPKRHKAVDARLDNCPTRRYLACLKSGASCSTLLATERSWPRVSATALTHWSITIGSLWPDASSGRWGRVAAGSLLHTDACWTRLVGAGLYWYDLGVWLSIEVHYWATPTHKLTIYKS